MLLKMKTANLSFKTDLYRQCVCVRARVRIGLWVDG